MRRALLEDNAVSIDVGDIIGTVNVTPPEGDAEGNSLELSGKDALLVADGLLEADVDAAEVTVTLSDADLMKISLGESVAELASARLGASVIEGVCVWLLLMDKVCDSE